MEPKRIIGGILTSTVLFTACNQEDNFTISSTKEVRLNASVSSLKTRIGSNWTGTEELGLFMINSTSAEFTPVNEISNKCYTVSSTGTMATKDGSTVNYPEDGSKVRFIAYYPFSAEITANKYPINLCDEAISDHDLLYTVSKAEYNKDQTTPVELNFQHQLSKLTVKLQDNNGNALENVTATISRYTQAEFDLATGTILNPGEVKQILFPMQANEGQSIILPGRNGKLNFEYDNRKFSWNVSEINFESGKQYIYTLKLTNGTEPEVPVEVVGNATIVDWESVEGSDILDEIKTVEFATPAFTGSLFAGIAIEEAALTLDYTEGDASEITVDVTVEGIEGITVESKTITLENGAGTISLPVQGTPATTGTATFTLSVNNETIGTATATVEQKTATPVYTSNVDLTIGDGSVSALKQSVMITDPFDCIKMGTGSKNGSWISVINPALHHKISFYACAWTGKTATLQIKSGSTILSTVSLEGNKGATDNSPYTIEDGSLKHYEIDLSEINDESPLVFEVTAGYRAILVGINAE